MNKHQPGMTEKREETVEVRTFDEQKRKVNNHTDENQSPQKGQHRVAGIALESRTPVLSIGDRLYAFCSEGQATELINRRRIILRFEGDI